MSKLKREQCAAFNDWRDKSEGIKSIPSTKVTIKAPVPEEKSLEERIQDAIKLLKENGYQVRKIKIEYEEV